MSFRAASARLALIEEGLRTDAFVVGEPTDLAILTLHAGSLNLQIHTVGVTRHLSKMEESVSAIDTMIRVIERLKNMTFSTSGDEKNPEYASVRRVNVGSMRAGLGRDYLDWRPPQVPDFATIKLAVRFGPGQSVETVVAEIEVPEQLHPPRAFEVTRNAPIVTAVASSYRRVMGSEPSLGAIAPYRYYGSDASHLQHVGGMKGVVCGAGGKYNTMPDERVETSQFHVATRIYALTALDVCS